MHTVRIILDYARACLKYNLYYMITRSTNGAYIFGCHILISIQKSRLRDQVQTRYSAPRPPPSVLSKRALSFRALEDERRIAMIKHQQMRFIREDCKSKDRDQHGHQAQTQPFQGFFRISGGFLRVGRLKPLPPKPPRKPPRPLPSPRRRHELDGRLNSILKVVGGRESISAPSDHIIKIILQASSCII
jgi:hypothetical protein